MEDIFNLERFIEAQEQSYQNALEEIRDGRKESHWMWYIFPQIKGLGNREFSIFYGLASLEEAEAYLLHPILGKRLVEICAVLLKSDETDAYTIFGFPDYLKLQSCLTLFSQIENSNEIIDQLLSKYFNSEYDEKTLGIIHT